jgi:polyphosphate kinase
MSSPQPQARLFLNRELSWLEFNSRVLEESRNSRNPLLERLRFYCIFHSNLDEFFMVRVAALSRQIKEEDHASDPAGFTAYEQRERILSRVRDLEHMSYALYNTKLRRALAKEKIKILQIEELNPAQQRYLDAYFDQQVYPVLTPLAIEQNQPFPPLLSLSVNLAVRLISLRTTDEVPRLAVVQVPGGLPGLCRLPHGEELELCWLADVIRRRLSGLFPGYQIVEAAGFRLTRDSELELDDEGRYDYVRNLEYELKKRRTADSTRLEFQEQMTPELRRLLQEGLGVDDSAMLPVKRPLDPRPLLSLADMPGYDKLHYPPQPPMMPAVFEQERNLFDIIRDGDILLHHPYDSFDPVVEFIQSAAEDPDVLAIKQTLYRTSGKGSRLLRSLVAAAENGKQVTVLVELTARFDEERNIDWARDLEEAGAHVIYGLAGLKVHAKVALVVRREPAGIRRYLHLATGNYNERTARFYTDFGLLTASDAFGADASGFFNSLTGYSEPPMFQRLVVSPLGLRERIVSLIRREADRARSGQISGILAKMNSLVDPVIIQELSAASTAGVSIRLNVRGICCLRPGVPGLSEHIRVISIVDRYLEHGRAFVFRNGGDAEVYLSSADWMPRNLDRRIELMFPVLDESAKTKVIEAVEAQFADNQKSRLLLQDGSYQRITPGRSDPVRVQEYLYRQLLEERERTRAVTPVRFVPIEGSRT